MQGQHRYLRVMDVLGQEGSTVVLGIRLMPGIRQALVELQFDGAGMIGVAHYQIGPTTCLLGLSPHIQTAKGRKGRLQHIQARVVAVKARARESGQKRCQFHGKVVIGLSVHDLPQSEKYWISVVTGMSHGQGGRFGIPARQVADECFGNLAIGKAGEGNSACTTMS